MNRRIFFLIGLLIECVAVFGLLLSYVYMTATGTAITLQTAPIDPRSFLRGDFMALDYEAGQDAPVSEYGLVKYVILEKNGELYERVAISDTKPSLQEGQVCLRGVTQYRTISFPDLSQYFIPENTGNAFAENAAGRYLYVDAAVDARCRSVIRGVRVGEKIPESELIDTFDPRPIDPPFEEKPIEGGTTEAAQ